VIIDNQEVTTLPPEKRGVGYVPQHPALFNHLTAWQNITYPLKNGRGSWERAERVASFLGLGSILTKRPRELSGGYKSRVSLARALMSEPKIMLLDEPLSDIDAATKEKLAANWSRLTDGRTPTDSNRSANNTCYFWPP